MDSQPIPTQPTSNKSFFDLLHPKQAFILGCITSFLLIGTIGFVLLGAYVLNGGSVEGAIARGEEAGGGSDDAADDAAPAPVAPTPSNAPVGEVPAVTGTDHVRGDANAPVTIIEYSDFQCPFCSRFHPTMKQVMEEYAGKVKWVFRHYPLSFHPEAEPAAEAAECAGEQGKFWEYADKLFENQADLGDDLYTQLAKDLGLNVSQFESCLSSDKYLDRIKSDMKGGVEAGVTGTPGSFVIDADGNAKAIKGALPYSSVQAAIEQAL
jgi:protein-disulfide isomerase